MAEHDPSADVGALHAAEAGASGPVIALLHGFGGTGSIWRGIVSDLAKHSRTIAYDLPGHGGSLTYPGAGPAKVAARAILADLQVRGIASAHVVGHSMGGAIAMLMAIVEPARIASLTLLAPGGIGDEINGPLLRRFAAATSAVEIGDALTDMSALDAWPAAIDDLIAARALPGQTEMLRAIVETIARNDRQGVIPGELLARIAVPVSVLWGTADAVLPVTQTRKLPQAFHVQTIEGAGHMLIEEAPGLVLSAIEANIRPGTQI